MLFLVPYFLASSSGVSLAGRSATKQSVVPFALSDVALSPTSAFGIAQQRNLDYVVGLNSSQLLCIYTSAANLTKCSGGNCPSPGGDDAPVCEPLPGEMPKPWYYGHYLGHWLSATAFLTNATGDEAVRAKATAVITALNLSQAAWAKKYGPNHDGYLFPYDPIVFEYLHTNSAGCASHLCGLYSVPYYTWHKVMAGLLDHATHAGSSLAWSMVLRMAGWVGRHAGQAYKTGGAANWQSVLNTEWGGMNEVLFNLYAITRDPSHLATGRLFNHYAWSAPLAAGTDDLAGNHANTHIPEVIGNARGFELTGNETDKAIALEFFAAVTSNHSWATGGSNDGEYWGPSRRMGDQMNGNTEESCTQYNILKVARKLFEWTRNVSLVDFYEKAILNGIVGNQARDDPSMTSFIYMLPLGGAGMRKPWGQSNRSFPCCWGTLIPTAKLVPGTYLSITREWRIGDTVRAHFPMSFGASPITDDRDSFNQTFAYTYGPLVLAGLTEQRWFVPDGPPEAPHTFIRRVPPSAPPAGSGSSGLHFEAAGQLLSPRAPNRAGLATPVHNASALSLVPIADVIRQSYTVYFDSALKIVPYAPAGATVPSDSPEDYSYSGGASSAGGPKDSHCSGGNIRSGDPGSVSRVQLDHPLLAPGYTIDSLSLSFRYVAGYTPPAGASKNASTLSVLLTDSSGGTLATVYSSPPLGNWSYDHFTGYSPPITAASGASPLNVPNDALVFVTIEVTNNERNLQIPIDDLSGGMNATVKWRKREASSSSSSTSSLHAHAHVHHFDHGHQLHHHAHASPSSWMW